jgi:hypothetical protein
LPTTTINKGATCGGIGVPHMKPAVHTPTWTELVWAVNVIQLVVYMIVGIAPCVWLFGIWLLGCYIIDALDETFGEPEYGTE